ncbi:hypothetical protein [EBPR siphovirus 2]|nr:hypothetical protein [EBPR siphovirus 2]
MNHPLVVIAANVIVTLAQTYTLMTISNWLIAPLTAMQALWLVLIADILSLGERKRGSREPWTEALPQTGFLCLIALAIALIVLQFIS